MAKQAGTIRQLARARSSKAVHRALLSPQRQHLQIGGGLPVVAAGILASIVVPLVAEIINSKA